MKITGEIQSNQIEAITELSKRRKNRVGTSVRSQMISILENKPFYYSLIVETEAGKKFSPPYKEAVDKGFKLEYITISSSSKGSVCKLFKMPLDSN